MDAEPHPCPSVRVGPTELQIAPVAGSLRCPGLGDLGFDGEYFAGVGAANPQKLLKSVAGGGGSRQDVAQRLDGDVLGALG